VVWVPGGCIEGHQRQLEDFANLCILTCPVLSWFLIARFSRTAVARVSDDYYPRDPASSTPHIGACAFNSLYLGALVQPDWDMFQSAHPAGERRCGSQRRGRGQLWAMGLG
jgi:raffinose synthase